MHIQKWFLNFRIRRLHARADSLLMEAELHRKNAESHYEAASQYRRVAMVLRDQADSLASSAAEAAP